MAKKPGKRIGDTTYVHRSATAQLPPSQRSRIARAAAEARWRKHRWNVAKLNDRNGSVTLLDYDKFHIKSHPELRRSLRVQGRQVGARSYSRENPPVLHRKGLLLQGGPLKMIYDFQTRREERSGYYDKGTRDIGTKRGHQARLRQTRR